MPFVESKISAQKSCPGLKRNDISCLCKTLYLSINKNDFKGFSKTKIVPYVSKMEY